MCLPWWSLILAFTLGILSMFAFWLLLARVAMGGTGIPTEGKGNENDSPRKDSLMGYRGNGG